MEAAIRAWSLRDRPLLNGSGVGTSIRELTAAMLKVAGLQLQPVHEPPDWRREVAVADSSAIRAALIGPRARRSRPDFGDLEMDQGESAR